MFQRMEKFIRRMSSSSKDPSLSQSASRKATLKDTAMGGLVSSNRIPCEATGDGEAKRAYAPPEAVSLQSDADMRAVLARDPVPCDELRALSWHGCPTALRCEAWGLLTGHVQPQQSSRAAVLARKRSEYVSYVHSHYSDVDWDVAFRTAAVASLHKQRARPKVVGEWELLTLKQVRKDIPRMSAGIAYLSHDRVKLSLERLLYLWAVRHPACGYVQGMSDLIIPFMSVVLADRFCSTKTVTELHAYTPVELESLFATEAVGEEKWMEDIEADIYWMAAYLLSGVQENYTYNQKGIHDMVKKLEGVVHAIDGELHHHLCEELKIDFAHFAFRWMNCLLLRELNVTQSLRLWDVYLADEEKDWSTTHVYVCAALLIQWSPALCSETDYSVTMRFLQHLPTEEITDFDALISQGIMLQKLYNNSPARLMLPR